MVVDWGNKGYRLHLSTGCKAIGDNLVCPAMARPLFSALR